MSSNLVLLVRETIEEYKMLKPGLTVIVGLSGGADSVSLLMSLNALKTEYDISLVAAHINHGLRGAEAKRDEDFAKELCNGLDIPFHVLHADVKKLAQISGESFESCGRRVRYEFFANIAEEIGRDRTVIATAHNAVDNVETIIFNLTRGTGLKGLCGIPPVRMENGIKVIRPIISCTREDILEYLSEINQDFVTDSTNEDTDYSRNRIRHNILPELLEINTSAISNIGRCSDTLRLDESFLTDCARKLVASSKLSNGYDAEVLRNGHPAIMTRAILLILGTVSKENQEKKNVKMVSELILEPNACGKVQVQGGQYVVVKNNILTLPDSEDSPSAERIEYSYSKNNMPLENEFFEIVELTEANKQLINLRNAVDYDKIGDKFIIRNRREGDRFKVPKRGVNKNLKSLFQEVGIEVSKRAKLLMMETDGKIAFIESIGPADGFVPTKTTTKVVVFKHL
ncbi:MAG: tRNA lysidine(34) synthetase TilS [Oscillospiraceae bacterium]|nr:tRNA lysidine(34) synthetase TilS [Oscillospiraceae bacterium]